MATLTTAPTTAQPSASDETSALVHESLLVVESLYLYNEWLFSNIRRFVGDNVLEVGAGIGNITQFLRDCSQVVALEPHLPSADHAKMLFAEQPNIRVIASTLENFSAEKPWPFPFDTVLCLNVLEHIKDDVHALRCMKKHLSAQGRVVILAPALPMLFGSLDRSLGHFRRYSRRSLKKKFDRAGLQVVDSFYINLPGVLGWFFHSRVLHRQQIARRAAERFNSIVPYISAAESIVKPPLGQSLVMIGQSA